MSNYSLFPFAPGRFQFSLGHDYALFPPRDAGDLDRRKQAPHLAADRTARQRGAREGRHRARRGISRRSRPAATNGSPTCPASSPASANWKKSLNHDVIGFTTAVAEKINDNASRWFHFGLTSSDVGDTCYAVQMQQVADILIADVKTASAGHRPARQGTQIHALHRPQPRHPRRADDVRPEAGADAR